MNILQTILNQNFNSTLPDEFSVLISINMEEKATFSSPSALEHKNKKNLHKVIKKLSELYKTGGEVHSGRLEIQ